VLAAILTMIFSSGDRVNLSLNKDVFNKKKLLFFLYGFAILSVVIILTNILFITPAVRGTYNFLTVFVVNNFNTIFWTILFISVLNIVFVHKKNKYIKTFYFYVIYGLLAFIIWDTVVPYIQMTFPDYFLRPRLNYVDLLSVALGTYLIYLFVKILTVIKTNDKDVETDNND
jgi:hypothetical protein